MIKPRDFSRKQLELMAEFGKYVFDHPEMDEILPEGAYVFFEITGDTMFNRYSRQLEKKQRKENGAPVVLVRVKGLAPSQGSRLIEPIVELAQSEKSRSQRAKGRA